MDDKNVNLVLTFFQLCHQVMIDSIIIHILFFQDLYYIYKKNLFLQKTVVKYQQLKLCKLSDQKISLITLLEFLLQSKFNIGNRNNKE